MTAANERDKQLAMLAWGGSILTGAIVPGVVWMTTRSDRGSLSFKQSRIATLLWLVALLAWLPTVTLGAFIPAFKNEIPGSVGKPWMAPMAVVIVGIPAVVSLLGLLRASRSRLLAPPQR